MSGLVSTLNMSAGTYVDISTPPNLETGQGQFPLAADKTIRINGQDRKHILGFVSENETVGTVEEYPDSKDIKVRYTHLKNESNRIYFYTASNEKYSIAIIAMPIHDHSSISQGGPAFGTYYYDKVVEQPEKEQPKKEQPENNT